MNPSYMPVPPVAWLKLVAEGRLEVSGTNVAKALRYRSFIQFLDINGGVIEKPLRLGEIAAFRVTARGQALLQEAATPTEFPFKRSDPPQDIKLWVSAFKRWARNCPKGLVLAYSDDQIHVLAKDRTGVAKDDDAHRVASIKVPWIGK